MIVLVSTRITIIAFHSDLWLLEQTKGVLDVTYEKWIWKDSWEKHTRYESCYYEPAISKNQVIMGMGEKKMPTKLVNYRKVEFEECFFALLRDQSLTGIACQWTANPSPPTQSYICF